MIRFTSRSEEIESVPFSSLQNVSVEHGFVEMADPVVLPTRFVYGDRFDLLTLSGLGFKPVENVDPVISSSDIISNFQESQQEKVSKSVKSSHTKSKSDHYAVSAAGANFGSKFLFTNPLYYQSIRTNNLEFLQRHPTLALNLSSKLNAGKPVGNFACEDFSKTKLHENKIQHLCITLQFKTRGPIKFACCTMSQRDHLYRRFLFEIVKSIFILY